MSFAKSNSAATLAPRLTYRLGNIIFLPHYTKNVFVAPGYPRHGERELEFTAKELEAAGARPVEMFLLTRGPKAAGAVES